MTKAHSPSTWERPIWWETSCLLAASIFHTFKVLHPFVYSVAAGTDVALQDNLLLADQINLTYKILEQEWRCSAAMWWQDCAVLHEHGLQDFLLLQCHQTSPRMQLGVFSSAGHLSVPRSKFSESHLPTVVTPQGWVSRIKTFCNKSLATQGPVWAICTMCCFCQDPLPLGLELPKMKFLKCTDCPHGCSSTKLILYILCSISVRPSLLYSWCFKDCQ